MSQFIRRGDSDTFMDDTIESLFSLGESGFKNALMKYSLDSLYEIAKYIGVEVDEKSVDDGIAIISEISNLIFPRPLSIWVSVKREDNGSFTTDIQLGESGGFGPFSSRSEALSVGDKYIEGVFEKEIAKLGANNE